MALHRPVRGPRQPPSSERARGALLGLAVGDALGVPVAGKRLQAPPFPGLAAGPHRELRGAPASRLAPGQVTAPTQLSTALASTLRANRGYHRESALDAYLAWEALGTGGDEVTRAALRLALVHRPREEAARKLWMDRRGQLATSGALARSAPLAVYLAQDPKGLARASMEDAAHTHFAPLCRLAAVAYNAALAAGLTAPDAPEAVDPEVMVQASQTALSLAAAQLGRSMPEHVHEVQEAVNTLREDLALARADDPRLYGPELHLHTHPGSLRVAFRLVFWELCHAPGLEAGLLDVTNRGGDTTTHGAMAGALLGARFGEQAIPPAWRNEVMEAQAGGRDNPLDDGYHPRTLLTLVDG